MMKLKVTVGLVLFVLSSAVQTQMSSITMEWTNGTLDR